MSLVERTLEYLQNRRDKILTGGINSIPSPFDRFSNEFIGIEQKKYYVVTGNQKSGKTQLASYLFLYTPLLYAFNNPDKIRIKVFYYALEESQEDVLQRFMSYLLNVKSNGDIRISPTDLQSSKNSKPVPQEVLEILRSDELQNILTFFENHIEFSASRNPTGVYQEVKKYMEENGTVHTKKTKVKDELGVVKEVNMFDYYEPNDPNEYVIVFFDHLSLVSTERGMTLKQTADKLSEYMVLLRNRYKITPVLIQQQTAEMESLDAFKVGKLKPSAQGLADTKYSSRDCNVLLGVFSPFRHSLPEYNGYNITKLKDNVRFLEVILNRGGSAGGTVALFFDGATCNWAELPPSNEEQKLSKVYNYIHNLAKKAYCFFIYSFKS